MNDTIEPSVSPPAAKRQKLSGSEVAVDTPDNELTQKALEDIEDCQGQIEELNEKASEEMMRIEIKYNKLKVPVFEKRNELIAKIDQFWLHVFLNHPRLANILDEEEEECLSYLKQVNIEDFEDAKSGFSVLFHFTENPFFTNDVLSKTYCTTAIVEGPRSKSTKIDWKPDMCLASGKQHNVHRGPSKPTARSFFSWFSQSSTASKDKVLEIIKEDIWPNPLQYYLASDMEDETNGLYATSDSEDDSDVQHIADDSVVIVGDDSEDDDDVYEVDGEDEGDREDSDEQLEETIESIEVDDDDEDDDDEEDDDAIEVLGSDSEAELEGKVHVITDTPEQNHTVPPPKPCRERDSIDCIMAEAVETYEIELLNSTADSRVDVEGTASSLQHPADSVNGDNDQTAPVVEKHSHLPTDSSDAENKPAEQVTVAGKNEGRKSEEVEEKPAAHEERRTEDGVD